MEWLLILVLNYNLDDKAGADIHTERLSSRVDCEKVGNSFNSIVDNKKYSSFRCIEIEKKK